MIGNRITNVDYEEKEMKWFANVATDTKSEAD